MILKTFLFVAILLSTIALQPADTCQAFNNVKLLDSHQHLAGRHINIAAVDRLKAALINKFKSLKFTKTTTTTTTTTTKPTNIFKPPTVTTLTTFTTPTGTPIDTFSTAPTTTFLTETDTPSIAATAPAATATNAIAPRGLITNFDHDSDDYDYDVDYDEEQFKGE